MSYDYRNQVLSDDDIRRIAPSVFAEAAHDSRSDRYRYYPTALVLDALRREGFLPVRAQQTRARSEKWNHTKHMIRFRHHDFLTGQNIGDLIPEMVLVNSHDGTSAYQLDAALKRLVCCNGLIVGEADFQMRVRHSGKKDVVRDVIDASFQVIETFPQVIAATETMKATNLSEGEQKAFATAALSLRWDEQESAPISAQRLLTTRRSVDDSSDLFTTYNVIQENIMKGGLRGISANTGKSIHTRAVKSVQEDVRINRALWVLAREMEELKKQAA
jgi:hypothetical protein